MNERIATVVTKNGDGPILLPPKIPSQEGIIRKEGERGVGIEIQLLRAVPKARESLSNCDDTFLH